jgi:thymidylate synthase (FAD)
MRVRLISLTQPFENLQSYGVKTAEDLIVHNARASNPSNQLNTATGEKLLRYCMEHGHWSVFEQASMGVEIVTSRAISAQILRHRSFHFQEFSQRYSEAQAFEVPQLRVQATNNRQSSTQVVDSPDIRKAISMILDTMHMAYKDLLEKGYARECARMFLPMCTQTTVYMTGTVRDWIHYLRLRTKEDTQLEHREIAQEIKRIFAEQFPSIEI